MILVSVGMLGFLAIRGIYMYTDHWRARKIADWDELQLRTENCGGNGRRGDQRWTFVYGY
jgi:hypothetical protein